MCLMLYLCTTSMGNRSETNLGIMFEPANWFGVNSFVIDGDLFLWNIYLFEIVGTQESELNITRRTQWHRLLAVTRQFFAITRIPAIAKWIKQVSDEFHSLFVFGFIVPRHRLRNQMIYLSLSSTSLRSATSVKCRGIH